MLTTNSLTTLKIQFVAGFNEPPEYRAPFMLRVLGSRSVRLCLPTMRSCTNRTAHRYYVPLYVTTQIRSSGGLAPYFG